MATGSFAAAETGGLVLVHPHAAYLRQRDNFNMRLHKMGWKLKRRNESEMSEEKKASDVTIMKTKFKNK